ncbi:hypothetical protein ACVWXN_003461 [Bradyrhizobium sp. i1.4.4]
MIFTDGLRLESPDRPVTDFDASFGAQLGATAAEAWSDSPTSQVLGLVELNAARGARAGMPETDPLGNVLGSPQELAQGPSVPTLTRAEAQDRVKQAGLEKGLTVPDQETIPAPVLDIMLTRARERAEREATIARGPQNLFAAGVGLGTSFLVGAIDPINIGSAFIPIMGELRYGKLLASAGESAIARAGVRAGVGAAQGVVGQAMLEPLDWYSHTQEGRDFGMSDVLHNLVFGAALGGALHSAGGAVSDVLRRRRGEAVYPFGPGEPAERASPLEILQDLPPRAQEDSMRAALAAITSGEPVKVGEMLQAAGKADPRIAESLDLAVPAGPRGPDAYSLVEFLASKGGLKADPELEAIYGGKRGPFVPRFGPLLRKDGMSLDDALSLAQQHGYFFDPHDVDNGTAGAGGRTSMGLTPRDLLDHLDRENRGQKLYKPGHVEATKYDPEQEKHVILRSLEDELEATGADPDAIDPHLLNRTVEIVHREGVSDVLAAYERAIMEDRDRYEGLLGERQQHAETAQIPGWDHPDGGPASRAGEAGPGERGQAGFPGDRPGPANGSEPRAFGLGDRTTGEGLSAPDAADWHDLLQRADEVDHPDVLEASRAADEAPEVKTKLDERVAAAEQADANSAELYRMFGESLPEAERARLDDALKALDEDHALQSEIIERSGACLFGARSA